MLISGPSASQVEGVNEFQHEPLPHPITYIRLLEISPVLDSEDSAIRCRLRCVRLTEYDQCYTALSYSWSHGAPFHNIYVNGVAVKIRSNLHDLLCLYREQLMLQTLPTVFLWVDALCLDFSSVRERNSQVQIMPNIFQRAKTVLAWLEPLSSPVGAQSGRPDLRSFVGFLGQTKKDLDQVQNYHNDRLLSTKYTSSSPSLPTPFINEWRTMLQLCRHRYWSRLWVLLENRFAQNLMFACGDVLWTWADFRAPFVLMWYLVEWQLHDARKGVAFNPAQILETPAAEVVKSRLVFESRSDFPSLRSSSKAFRYANAATERWHLTSVREPLSTLLKLHGSRQCSDQLDKVYALIGLSDSTMTVDYDRNNIELFCAVLLSLKASYGLNFVSMLAHHLGISAYQYQEDRRSTIENVPLNMDQSTVDIVGGSCDIVLQVKEISARTEISDVIQARLGVLKLNYFQITAHQDIGKMAHWNDLPSSSKDLPRLHGHTPGAPMPIVDGFDLSDTSFHGAMFLNPTSRSSRKTVFGTVSTNAIEEGDVLVTDETMHSGIIIRVSGLKRTWLTVIGVVCFARRVTVESQPSSPLAPSPTSTIRSTTLGDFCEQTRPTSFTITSCDDRAHFTLRPHDIQQQGGLLRGSSSSRMRYSCTSSNTTKTSNGGTIPTFAKIDPKISNKSSGFGRILDFIRSGNKSSSK